MAVAEDWAAATGGEPPALPVSRRLDPTAPVAEPASQQAAGRAAQRQRRARILAAVRMLIATRGVDHVTLRTLAEASELSVQTIYNLVGNRMDVVEAAISQHIELVAHQHRALGAYPSSFIAMGDIMWGNLVSNAIYSRNATIACCTTEGLRQRVHRRHSGALKRMLHRQYRVEADRRRIDLEIVASHVTFVVSETAAEWARGAMDDMTLRYHLTSAYGLAVGSLVTSEERDAINGWLAQARQAIPRVRQATLA